MYFLLGKWSKIWPADVSNGLVQPPTSNIGDVSYAVIEDYKLSHYKEPVHNQPWTSADFSSMGYFCEMAERRTGPQSQKSSATKTWFDPINWPRAAIAPGQAPDWGSCAGVAQALAHEDSQWGEDARNQKPRLPAWAGLAWLRSWPSRSSETRAPCTIGQLTNPCPTTRSLAGLQGKAPAQKLPCRFFHWSSKHD